MNDGERSLPSFLYKTDCAGERPEASRSKNLRAAALLLAANLLAYLPLCVFHGESYSVDSPSILLYGEWVHYSAFIDSYRWFGALTAKLLSLTGHDPIHNCTPDIILLILMAAAGTAALVLCLKNRFGIKDVLSLAAIDLASVISVENVWFCDILTFPESIFLTGVGLLACLSSVIVFVKHKTVKGWLLSSLLLICATTTYQQYATVFAVFIVAIVSREVTVQKDCALPEAAARFGSAAGLIAVSCAVGLGAGKLVSNAFHIDGGSRMALVSTDILDNLKFFITRQHSFLKGRGYFQTEILTVGFLALGLLWFVCLCRYARQKKTYAKAVLVLAAYAAAYAGCYLFGVISASQEPRVLFGVFSVFFLFTLGIDAKSKTRLPTAAVCCILAVILAANAVVITERGRLHRESNQRDLSYAAQITQAIEDYERQNGVTVTSVAYCYDAQSDKYEGNSLFSFDFSLEAILTLQSSRYEPDTEKIYEFREMPEDVYRRYFEGKNWDAPDLNEQLVFLDDAAYLCVY